MTDRSPVSPALARTTRVASGHGKAAPTPARRQGLRWAYLAVVLAFAFWHTVGYMGTIQHYLPGLIERSPVLVRLRDWVLGA